MKNLKCILFGHEFEQEKETEETTHEASDATMVKQHERTSCARCGESKTVQQSTQVTADNQQVQNESQQNTEQQDSAGERARSSISAVGMSDMGTVRDEGVEVVKDGQETDQEVTEAVDEQEIETQEEVHSGEGVVMIKENESTDDEMMEQDDTNENGVEILDEENNNSIVDAEEEFLEETSVHRNEPEVTCQSCSFGQEDASVSLREGDSCPGCGEYLVEH